MNNEKRTRSSHGFILPIVIIVIVVLSALATGLIMASYGARLQAVRIKNDTAAMLAAEAVRRPWKHDALLLPTTENRLREVAREVVLQGLE